MTATSFILCAHLEDVKCFKLDVSAIVSQHVHHQLEVLGHTDVFRHDSKVVSVQKKFPKELKQWEKSKYNGLYTHHVQVKCTLV